MLVYALIIILLIYGIHNFDIHKAKRGSTGFFYLVLICLILVTGLQNEWGKGDFYAYMLDYSDYVPIGQLNINELVLGGRLQPLWVILVGFIKSINPSYEFFIFCHSIIINTIYLSFIRKNTKYVYSTIAIFILTMNYFMVNLEVQRESLAVCIFLMSLNSLMKKHYVFYYILTVIAFLFHVSALFMVFVPMLMPLIKNLGQKKMILLIIGLLVGITYLPSLFQIHLIGDITALQGALEQANYYASLDSNFTNTLTLSIFEASSCVLLLYIYIKSKKDKNVFLLLLIMEIFVVFGNSFVPGLYRIRNYTMIPVYVVIAQLTFDTAIKYKKIVLIFYLFFTVSTLYSLKRPAPYIGPDKYRYNMWLPYRSIFDEPSNSYLY